MRANFDESLSLVLKHEGGFVDDPRDPGGRTNHGITQTVYNDWHVANGLPEHDVKDITAVEVMAVYKKRYWDAVKGDELPAGVDYCVFDFAVNSGVSRASRYLQRAVGAVEDGKIGPATLAAVLAKDAADVIDAVCGARLAFLRQLAIFDRFGKGWTRRVNDVRAKAEAMAA